MPIYGDGKNIRDWLYVEDHVRALYKVVNKGKIGETYNIGSNSEKTNIEVVTTICEILDRLAPLNSENKKIKDKTHHKKNSTKLIKSYKDLITFVKDRPGHDLRYAINSTKIQKELKWTYKESFETGLKKTVEWYMRNFDWTKKIEHKKYHRQRLGLLLTKKK